MSRGGDIRVAEGVFVLLASRLEATIGLLGKLPKAQGYPLEPCR